MRVLQLHTRYRQKGGEDTAVDAEAKVLRQAGHVVEQYFSTNPPSNVKAIGALVMSPWNPASARHVARVLANFRPDIVHLHNTWYAMSPSVLKACGDAGVPVVMTLHNYRLTCANGLLFRDGKPCHLCVGSHPWHAVRYGCYRDSRIQSIPAAATIALHRQLGTWMKHVNRFIAATEFQRGLMVQAGWPEDKIVIKPNFISDPGPRPQPPSRSKTILYVGRISKEKGVDLLISAWTQAEMEGFELLVVGDGPIRSELEEIAPGNVKFLGNQPPLEVCQLMLTSRAGVVPSRWYEGMPLVQIEAMAAGMPIAMSDVPASRNIMESTLSENWLFRVSDPDSWQRIMRMLRDHPTCDAGGASARRAFLGGFDARTAADDLLAIYQSARTDRDR